MLVLTMAIGFLGYSSSLTQFNNYNLYEFLLQFSQLSLPFAVSPRCLNILKTHNIKPKAVYENLDNPDMKKALKELKNLSGIYLIINLINGKKYVGSSIKMDMRFLDHLFTNGQGSKLVEKGLLKYGLGNFAFIVLDIAILEVIARTPENKKVLLAMENLWIRELSPEYNLAPEAGSNLGFKHTDETKKIYQQIAFQRPPMSLETRKKVADNSAKARL